MKIVHLADLHLGFRSYYKIDSNGINLRESDVMQTFREALKKVSEIQPDLVVLAGDIFHRPRPSNLTIFQTIHLLNLFRKKCTAPIFIISGNHECVKTFEAGNVLNIIEATVPGVLVIDGEIKEQTVTDLDLLFVGVPYNALPQLKDRDIKPDRQFKYNILSIHGSYDSDKCPELSRYGKEELLDEEKINQAEWDYIALGHYHSFTELASNCYYSGSIERTSTNIWKESKEQKGFIEYDLDEKKCIFHPLETPRPVFDIKSIDADGLSAKEIDALLEQEMLKIKEIDKSIVRVTVENIDNISRRELDYQKIREYKKGCVHFRLNLIKRDTKVQKGSSIAKKKGINELLKEELESFELSHELDKARFEELAFKYINQEVLS